MGGGGGACSNKRDIYTTMQTANRRLAYSAAHSAYPSAACIWKPKHPVDKGKSSSSLLENTDQQADTDDCNVALITN